MKGIVFDGSGIQVVDDLQVGAIGPSQVRVRMHAAGLCHSDVSVIDGTIPFPTPVVLGHEGAGVIEEVGVAVKHVVVGDHVVLSTLTNCGACPECGRGRPTMCRQSFGTRPTPFLWGDRPTHNFANASTFIEETVVEGNQVVPISRDVSLGTASLIGCAVMTGVGAVLNRAHVRENETAVVIGAGGIGLNVVQACRLVRASRIVVVDSNPDKERLARQFGATDFISGASAEELPDLIREILPEGADHVFECVGAVALIEAAADFLAWRGQLILVGVPPAGARASFDIASLFIDKSILGLRYGSASPHTDIPRYLELYRNGHLMLDELVSDSRPMEDIEALLHELEHGTVARTILTM